MQPGVVETRKLTNFSEDVGRWQEREPPALIAGKLLFLEEVRERILTTSHPFDRQCWTSVRSNSLLTSPSPPDFPSHNGLGEQCTNT